MNYGAISSNPFTVAVAIGLILLVAFIAARAVIRNYQEKQIINEIIAEGEQQKDSNGRSRDSRKQGTASVESDIEGSDRSKSDRSEFLMEEKDKKGIEGRSATAQPRSLIAAEQELRNAEESLRQIERLKGVARPSTTVAAEMHQRNEVERLRSVRNEVLIETRQQRFTRHGAHLIACQYRIGQPSAPTGAA